MTLFTTANLFNAIANMEGPHAQKLLAAYIKWDTDLSANDKHNGSIMVRNELVGTPKNIANWLTPEAKYLNDVAPFYRKHLPHLFKAAPKSKAPAASAKSSSSKTQLATKAEVMAVYAELDALVADFAKSKGLVIKKKGGTFAPGSMMKANFELAVVSSEKSEAGTTVTAAGKKEWNAYCWKFNMPKDMVGKVIKFGGEDYVIEGIRKQAKKAPVLARKLSTNKVWALPSYAAK